MQITTTVCRMYKACGSRIQMARLVNGNILPTALIDLTATRGKMTHVSMSDVFSTKPSYKHTPFPTIENPTIDISQLVHEFYTCVGLKYRDRI